LIAGISTTAVVLVTAGLIGAAFTAALIIDVRRAARR
jgi:hypothetical protein